MKPLRLYGDPFASDSAASALRALLELSLRRGFRPSLCLSAVQKDKGTGRNVVELGDGVRTFAVASELTAAQIEMLQRAASTPVPATSPVVVFAKRRFAAEMMAMAGLEWPRACTVRNGGLDSAQATLDRIEAELRWAGTEDPAISSDLPDLEAYAALPQPPADGPVLHVGAEDHAAGSDLAVRAFFAACPDSDRTLRIVLPRGAETTAARLAALAQEIGGASAVARLDFVLSPLDPMHVVGCSAVLQPLRRLFAGDVLALLLASGRPVVATRYHATAAALGAPGTCIPVGGVLVTGTDGLPMCEPDLDNVICGLRAALGDAESARSIGNRARAHAIAELSTDRPAAPPRKLPATGKGERKPVVVLEAPFFEVSSSAELSIETARALLRRGEVDLRLVPSLPFRADLDLLRARAPELCSRLARDPQDVDLWLSTGWPPRAERPDCRTFALRIDWEYGALPTELVPLVAQEADVVVVHSRHVEKTVAAAGCPPSRIVRIPHGVDAETFHETVAADRDLLAWKGDLPLVLFVGGMVFRKGFDVLMRMALDAHARGARFALCAKTVGHGQHYAGYHMGELAERVRTTKGAPPMRILNEDVSRQQLASIYRAADLLCHPYRGEGFGMPVLEARACGVPVMVTRGGSTDDFATGEGTIGLSASRRAIDLPGAHLGQPWVLEPDAARAGELLAQSLQNLPRLRAAAQAAAGTVRSTFSWDAAAIAVERLAAEASVGHGRSVQVSQMPALAPL